MTYSKRTWRAQQPSPTEIWEASKLLTWLGIARQVSCSSIRRYHFVKVSKEWSSDIIFLWNGTRSSVSHLQIWNLDPYGWHRVIFHRQFGESCSFVYVVQPDFLFSGIPQ